MPPKTMPDVIRRLLGQGSAWSGNEETLLRRAAERLDELTGKAFAFAALRAPDGPDEAVIATMAELKETVFFRREDSGFTEEDFRAIADWLTEKCAAILSARGVPPEKFEVSTDALNRYFLAALRDLQAGNSAAALRSLRIFASYGEEIFRAYPHLFFYQGLARYGTGDYEGAAADFRRALRHTPGDEIARFHLGNALFRQQRFEEAIAAYSEALDRRQDFKEALINCALAVRMIGDDDTAREIAADDIVRQGVFEDGTLKESPLLYTLAIPPGLAIHDIPIFINSFNRLGSLRRLVGWLTAAGCRKIYILDNDSTYPPLLEYYRQFDEDQGAVTVLRLRKNLGHTALWQSGVLEILHIGTPYVYTDPDIVPADDCPPDVLSHLLDILRKYPFLKKAGLGLKTDDITYPGAAATRKAEARFYQHEMEPGVYFGALDTTFALYRNVRHYNLYVAARTTGRFMARHLPWYYDYDNLPEDERYYMDHVNESATLVRKMKEGNLSRQNSAKEPLVSVIMPVYNACAYLGEAIESILHQTYTNWELLAIDDGSSDDSPAILREYARHDQRIHVITHPENKGLPAARNTGIRHAEGKYLALMDADDISLPERLEKQTDFMERNPQVDVCGSFAKTFGTESETTIKKPVTDREIKLNMLLMCAFVSASAMLRAAALRKNDLYFDESRTIAEDYEFWCRAMNRLTFHNLPEVLYLYRIVDSSLVHGNPEKLMMATHTIIARNLNALSTVNLPLPALHKPNCTDDELTATINDLNQIIPHRKPSCIFSPAELQIVIDYLIHQCQMVLKKRNRTTPKTQSI